jgi:hypothetical protein
MKVFHDYDTLWRAMAWLAEQRAPQLESFRGVDIVNWHAQIERALLDFIEKYEAAHNPTYVDKLREFLKQWRENRISGSINRETLELLLKPAEILAVDNWQLSRFFMGVANSLRVIIASEEELPRAPGGRSVSPKSLGLSTTDFGPEKLPPEGEGKTEADVASALQSAVSGAIAANT